MTRFLRKINKHLFYLLLFALPWQTRLFLKKGYLAGSFWEYGTFSLYGTDLLLLIVFFLFLIDRNKKKISYFSPLNLVILAWLILISASVLVADNKEIALFHLVHWWLYFLLFILIIGWSFDLKKALFSFSLGALFQGVFAWWQFTQQKILANKWLGLASHNPALSGASVVENDAGRFLRAYGALPHPNILAGFFLLAFFLGLILYFLFRKKYKYFILFILFFIILGLVLTFSRAGTLAFVFFLAFLLLVFCRFKKKQSAWLILVSLFVFFLFNLLFSSLIFPRWQGQGLREQQSLRFRQLYQEQSFKLIKSNFILGVGLNNFTWASFNKFKPEISHFDYQPVPNIYLLIFSELSLGGLVIFFSLIGIFLKEWWREIRQRRVIGILAGLPFLSLLFLGLFDHYPLSLPIGLLFFWLSLGFFQRITQVVDNFTS
jgi:O-antigen ligase